MSMEYKETCPPEINAKLPWLGSVMWGRRRMQFCFKVFVFGGFLLYTQWKEPNWLFIAGILVLLLVPEMGFWRLIAWTTRPFVRQGANDWVESTNAGEICVVRNGRRGLALRLSECQWMEVPDLRVMSKYNDFPEIHVLVVARWTKPAFWQKAPLIMCGFTEESREKWRAVFAEAGLEEQRAG